jgi:tetratricopeptide (TPR) repeat protein
MGFWPFVIIAALGREGDSLTATGRQFQAERPREALGYFRRALQRDSLAAEPNWRAAVALVDIGQETPDSIPSPARDSSYAEAERLARRAIRADSGEANAHFALALALGRVALTKPKRDRVKYGVAVYEEATRALAINPGHDGAHHVLARWNAEVMRLSGLTRFMARTLLGGKVFGKASWAGALEHLETAVQIAPGRILHRLDLARIEAERGRFGAARRELQAIEGLPARAALDGRYREEARRLLGALAGRADRPRA